MNDREARLMLARLVEPGSWSVHRAVTERGAVEVARALSVGRPVPGISRRLTQGAEARADGWDLGQEQRRLEAVGGQVLVPGDPGWPDGLTWEALSPELAAPPWALFVRGVGELAEVTARSVAVVGARACSSYGGHVARTLALGLADRGVTVVSGGAYGIDAHAHRGALAGTEARTVAVLACGVDVVYPRGNAQLLNTVTERGLLVSEVLPGSTPTRARFLVRNRLIAALTRGTVVVEAALRSGSLSTAHRAHELGRTVMAVPGPVTCSTSDGCHVLLRDEQACLVTGAADVLALVGRAGEDLPGNTRGPTRVRDGLSESARQLLEVLPVSGGIGEAAIAQAVGVSVLVVQQLLPPLQINGLIQRGETGWALTALGAGGTALGAGGTADGP